MGFMPDFLSSDISSSDVDVSSLDVDVSSLDVDVSSSDVDGSSSDVFLCLLLTFGSSEFSNQKHYCSFEDIKYSQSPSDSVLASSPFSCFPCISSPILPILIDSL